MRKINLLAILIVISGVLITTSCSETANSQSEKESSTAVISDNGFVYDIPAEAYSLDLSGKEHLKPANDFKVISENIDNVIEFDYSAGQSDYFQYHDDLGKYYLKDKYNVDCWDITEEVLNNGDVLHEAKYHAEGYNGSLTINSGAFLCYCDEGFNLADNISFDKGDTVIFDDDTEYKLNDGTSITYGTAVKMTEELIKGYETIVNGKDTSEISEVTYNEEKKAIKVNYLSRINGLKISKIKTVMNLNSIEEDQLSVHTSNDFPRKQAYVYSSDGCGRLLVIDCGELVISETAKHDKIITLQSSIDYLDSSVAKHLNFEVRGAELKYLLTASENKQANGDITLGDPHGIPVWEIILYNSTEDQEYAFVMNAIDGKISLIKINRKNDPVINF